MDASLYAIHSDIGLWLHRHRLLHEHLQAQPHYGFIAKFQLLQSRNGVCSAVGLNFTTGYALRILRPPPFVIMPAPLNGVGGIGGAAAEPVTAAEDVLWPAARAAVVAAMAAAAASGWRER